MADRTVIVAPYGPTAGSTMPGAANGAFLPPHVMVDPSSYGLSNIVRQAGISQQLVASAITDPPPVTAQAATASVINPDTLAANAAGAVTSVGPGVGKYAPGFIGPPVPVQTTPFPPGLRTLPKPFQGKAISLLPNGIRHWLAGLANSSSLARADVRTEH